MTTILAPPWQTPNSGRDSKAFCPHCSNHGIIVIDGFAVAGHMSEIGAPCPMCHRGRSFDMANYAGKYWLEVRPLDSVTWQHGATFLHTHRCQFAAGDAEFPCGKPATGQFCTYHDDADARRAGASGRHVPTARIAQAMRVGQ